MARISRPKLSLSLSGPAGPAGPAGADGAAGSDATVTSTNVINAIADNPTGIRSAVAQGAFETVAEGRDLTLADNHKTLYVTNVSGTSFGLSDLDWPSGSEIKILRAQTAGPVLFFVSGGLTINNVFASMSVSPGSEMTLKLSDVADTWELVTDIIPTNEAVVAAIATNPAGVRAAAGQKQPVSNVAIFGDSRAAQSGTDITMPANGIAYWFQLATGFRMDTLINPDPLGVGTPQRSFSQGGESFGSLNNDAGSYPRVAELIAEAPTGTVVLMYCGTNGLDDPAQEFADFQTVTERFQAAGLYPVAFLEPYLGASDGGTTYDAEHDTYNSSVKAYCDTNGVPYIDGMELFASSLTESYDSLFYDDGGYIHPNVKGCSVIGTAFARKVEEAFVLPASIPVNYRLVKGSLSVNEGFINGAFGNGTSTGFTASGTNCTLVKTMVRRTDGQPGYWADLVITLAGEGAATSGTGAGYMEMYNSLTGGLLPADDGSEYYGVCEIIIDEWDETLAAADDTNARFLYLSLSASGGVSTTRASGVTASQVLYQTHTLGDRGSASPMRGTSENRTCLITPTMAFPTGTTTFSLTLRVYGNCHVRVGNIAIVKVP